MKSSTKRHMQTSVAVALFALSAAMIAFSVTIIPLSGRIIDGTSLALASGVPFSHFQNQAFEILAGGSVFAVHPVIPFVVAIIASVMLFFSVVLFMSSIQNRQISQMASLSYWTTFTSVKESLPRRRKVIR